MYVRTIDYLINFLKIGLFGNGMNKTENIHIDLTTDISSNVIAYNIYFLCKSLRTKTYQIVYN